MAMEFKLEATDSSARAGELATSHGRVQTPAFMPVGTRASVKAVDPDDLRNIGAQIILSNTYHLSLRPGIETVQRLGGLHRFMAWDGPVLTDSGGFQVFSLGHLRRLNEDGVRFRSHLDGSEQYLSPELAVEYQEALGSDIAMVLDHPPAYGESDEEVAAATERTHRWAERCRRAQRNPEQALFAIVQGGWSEELRRGSAEFLASLDFPGYAIGGVSVGEPKALAYRAVEHSVAALPSNKPRYLMGVGSPEDLVTCIGLGIDMFDCALPTRVARNGGLFTAEGRLNLRRAKYAGVSDPVEAGCDCYTCRTFSAAYLHHLLRADELLYHRLASIHNLRFVLRLLEQARKAIIEGGFGTFAERFLGAYRVQNEEARLAQKDKWLEARRARGLDDLDPKHGKED